MKPRSRSKSFSQCLALLLYATLTACRSASSGEEVAAAPVVLARHYRDGERINYHMTATNQDRTKTLHYSADAEGVVVKNAAGIPVEEIDWSGLVVDGHATPLPAGGAAVHEQLSLSPDFALRVPDLRQTHPRLIGPVTDLLTFYADMQLAMRGGKLAHAGDHFRFEHGQPISWADGAYLLIGEDAIDFDVTLTRVDVGAQTATILVRHIPPSQPGIHHPAEWTREPVAGSPNNWIQVIKLADDKVLAQIGLETFDVEIETSLVDGRILAAHMDNVVDVLERECTDATLVHAGDPVRYKIHRVIEIR